MEFQAPSETERSDLLTALHHNATQNRPILMDRHDTHFVGATDEITDDEVIGAIKSVPCHY